MIPVSGSVNEGVSLPISSAAKAQLSALIEKVLTGTEIIGRAGKSSKAGSVQIAIGTLYEVDFKLKCRGSSLRLARGLRCGITEILTGGLRRGYDSR